MSDTETVVKFFLNIFRLQTEFGEKQTAKCEFRQVADESQTDLVYEFLAECGGKWKTRRMSIRQLGESVESKSTCFKVIYDNLIVVKIPPRPFPNFDIYFRFIQTEKRIANQLAPDVACLSPSISGILKKIPQIQQSKKTMLETEDDYVRLLTREPGLQNYLKVGNRLAFFMELSRYAFLNQLIVGIHEKKLRIPKFIHKNREALFDLNAFETIYGPDQDDIFFELNRLYGKYMKRLDGVVEYTDGLLSIPDYLREEWFFDRMAGRTPDIQSAGYSAGTAENIENALSTEISKGKYTLKRYTDLVDAHLEQKIFEASRSKIAALIINTLELLGRLKQKAVAVRDLKPDNIFVAQNFDGADHILGDPSTYDLGLIDLETAVAFAHQQVKNLDQPLMAGTPSFMTPSQVFSNPVLHELFGNRMFRLFYMQDWYAAIGITFNIVTGKHLFYRTAKLIPEIIRLKKKNANQPGAIFKRVSWNFWHTAEAEMTEKIKAHQNRLNALQVNLPEYIRKTLAAEAIEESAVLSEALHQLVHTQTFFPKNRDALINATAESIRKNRLKRENQAGESKEQSQIVAFLKTLETLKAQIPITRAMARLPQKTLSAGEIMHILFYRTFFAMYNPTWSARGLPVAAGDSPFIAEHRIP